MTRQGSGSDLGGVRALLFDTFGTVVDWRSGIAREMAAFLERHAIAGDAAEFADGWRRLYQPAMEEIRQGRRPFTRLDVLNRENLEQLLASRGVDPAALDLRELEVLNRAWHRLDPWPDSVEGLARLRRRYLIAPLSNGNILLLTEMAKRAGIPWDCILGAEVVQAYKPLPAAYLRTADILGLQPKECMMVAAHNDDLAAAADVGMKTAFVLRSREHGPGQTSDLAPDGPWDVVADDMLELARKLS